MLASPAFDGLLQGEELAYLGTEPERDATYAEVPDSVAASVRVAVGVESLYSHQRATWDAVAHGDHVCIATGTASGKTLAFNLPVLDAVARDPKVRALYLYPTKALAQDQFRTLTSLALPELRPAIYDGDTPLEHRRDIRRTANVVLTNPDMVHIGVAPNHDRWGDFLANLRFVVVDEAHVYRGVFGSHVANVLRRLRRLAHIYGASPQVVLASATIANPGELGAALLGERVTVLASDGAPHSERTIVLWNPPLVDAELGLRGSALAEAAKLQATFVEHGLRTLTFAKSRKAAELIHRFTAERLGDDGRLSPYRAGYTASQRRDDRATARGRRSARGERHERPRARDRHRPARLRHLGRISRNGVLPPPAMGSSRPTRQRPRRPDRVGGCARPVLHARPGEAPRSPSRGGDPRPRQPTRACRSRSRGGI